MSFKNTKKNQTPSRWVYKVCKMCLSYEIKLCQSLLFLKIIRKLVDDGIFYLFLNKCAFWILNFETFTPIIRRKDHSFGWAHHQSWAVLGLCLKLLSTCAGGPAVPLWQLNLVHEWNMIWKFHRSFCGVKVVEDGAEADVNKGRECSGSTGSGNLQQVDRQLKGWTWDLPFRLIHRRLCDHYPVRYPQCWKRDSDCH
jgi:hypothetical protein